MQYYINEPSVYKGSSLIIPNNKLTYILKKNKINHVKNSDNVVLFLDKSKLNFTIYLADSVPQFVMVNNNSNDYISSKCDSINMNIDKYEFVEDIVCEIIKIYQNSLTITLPIESKISKDFEKFNKLLEEKKNYVLKKINQTLN